MGEKFKQKFLSDEPSENEFNIILPKFIKKIIKDYLYTPSVENLQCSALTYAAQWGDKKMIDYLIKQGCNVDIIDREGHSALMSATNNNRKDCVIALVEAGASVNLVRGQNRFSVLHSAIFPQRNLIKSIRNEIVEYLIKHSVDVNCTSCSEESILSSSVINDDIDIVKYLIEAGALVNHRNKFGTTALHYAVIRKNREIIGFLLKYGADPNIKSNFDINKKYIYALPTFMDDKNTWFNEFKKHLYFPDTTPLHLAVQVGSTDITKMLIDANADLSIKNSKGKTAFEIAEDRGETEIVDIFKKAEYLKVTFNESNSNQKVNELSQAMSFSAEQPSFSGLEPQLNKENDRLFHHSEVWIPSNPDTRGL